MSKCGLSLSRDSSAVEAKDGVMVAAFKRAGRREECSQNLRIHDLIAEVLPLLILRKLCPAVYVTL